MTLAEQLTWEFDRELGATARLFEALPAAHWDWAPRAGAESLAALAAHVAALPLRVAAILDGEGTDVEAWLAPPDAFSRDEVIASLRGSAEAVRRALAGRVDQELMAPWTLRRGGGEIFTAPRLTAIRREVLAHLVHHRGQLTVYLGLLGIRGPVLYDIGG